MYDLTDRDLEAADELFTSLRLKVPAIVVCNKADKAGPEVSAEALAFFSAKSYAKEVLVTSALEKQGIEELVAMVLKYLPEGMAFYNDDDLSDLPTKFFVSEMIREKIFELYHEEIPYQATVLVQEFKEKLTLVKIQADIIVHRETQKFIVIGEKGRMIKQLGTEAREAIEAFLGQKVFLELYVKVRPKWRDDELKLREYGY
jgi:GTP-binding protein Era